MGIRNKVNTSGWVSENIGGNDAELDLGSARQVASPMLGIQVVRSGAAAAARAATSPVILMAGAAGNVTASLPSISTSIVGKTFMVVSTGSIPTLLTASNTINFGAWTRTISNSNLITCVAASTDAGFTWLASSGSAI